jgi:hypothetical protein
MIHGASLGEEIFARWQGSLPLSALVSVKTKLIVVYVTLMPGGE